MPFVQDDSAHARDRASPGSASAPTTRPTSPSRRADLFPLAICQSGVYDVSVVGWRRARRRRLLQQPGRLRRAPRRRPPRLAARPRQPAAARRPGTLGGHDGRAREHEALRRSCSREKGIRARARRLGPRRRRTTGPPGARRSRTISRGSYDAFRHAPDRAPARHRGGLADRVRASARPASARSSTAARRTSSPAERITNEPFDLRYAPALRARDRPARLVVHGPARVAEEDLPDGRRLPAQQPVHVPGDGEALGLLRDDAARAEGARDLADPAQEPAGQPALRADGGALQPALRPRRDRRQDRLPALHEAVRRRPVGRRHADPRRRRSSTPSTTSPASG